MERGAWLATVHGKESDLTERLTRLLPLLPPLFEKVVRGWCMSLSEAREAD